MKKENYTAFIIVIIVLVVALCSSVAYSIISSVKAKENDSLICIMDDGEDGYLELQFDYHNGSVYKYSIIGESKNTLSDDKIAYMQNWIEENDKKINGITHQLVVENGRQLNIEIYDFTKMSDEDIKERTGISREEWKTKTRESLKEYYKNTMTCN